MAHSKRSSPFDEHKLGILREFLRREFRGESIDETYDVSRTAQQFTIKLRTGRMHRLLVGKDAFEADDFVLLLDQRLLDTLHDAGERLVRLTAGGARIV